MKANVIFPVPGGADMCQHIRSINTRGPQHIFLLKKGNGFKYKHKK